MNWGITREIFIDAWMKAPGTRKERYTILNQISMTEQLFSNIYDELFIATKTDTI